MSATPCKKKTRNNHKNSIDFSLPLHIHIRRLNRKPAVPLIWSKIPKFLSSAKIQTNKICFHYFIDDTVSANRMRQNKSRKIWTFWKWHININTTHTHIKNKNSSKFKWPMWMANIEEIERRKKYICPVVDVPIHRGGHEKKRIKCKCNPVIKIKIRHQRTTMTR